MVIEPHTEDDKLGWLLINLADFDALREEIREALEGDSNDAEHDALVSVASTLGVEYRDPDDFE